MTFWPNEDHTNLKPYGKVLAIECKPTEEFKPATVSDFVDENGHYRIVRNKDSGNIQTWIKTLLERDDQPIHWAGSLDRFEWSESTKAIVQRAIEKRLEPPSKTKRRANRAAREAASAIQTAAAGSSGDPPPPSLQHHGTAPSGPPARAPPHPPVRNPDIPEAWDPGAPQPPPGTDPNAPPPFYLRKQYFPHVPQAPTTDATGFDLRTRPLPEERGEKVLGCAGPELHALARPGARTTGAT